MVFVHGQNLKNYIHLLISCGSLFIFRKIILLAVLEQLFPVLLIPLLSLFLFILVHSVILDEEFMNHVCNGNELDLTREESKVASLDQGSYDLASSVIHWT